MRSSFRRWWERHMCRKTTVELVITKEDGYKPQIRLRVIHKCNGWVMGEAYFNPDRMDELCREGQRLASQIRDEREAAA